MFGISFSELLIIFLIVLVIFGPDKLPQIAKTLGKAVREFNRKTDEIKGELQDVLNPDEPKSLPTAKTIDLPQEKEAQPSSSKEVIDDKN